MFGIITIDFSFLGDFGPKYYLFAIFLGLDVVENVGGDPFVWLYNRVKTRFYPSFISLSFVRDQESMECHQSQKINRGSF